MDMSHAIGRYLAPYPSTELLTLTNNQPTMFSSTPTSNISILDQARQDATVQTLQARWGAGHHGSLMEQAAGQGLIIVSRLGRQLSWSSTGTNIWYVRWSLFLVFQSDLSFLGVLQY